MTFWHRFLFFSFPIEFTHFFDKTFEKKKIKVENLQFTFTQLFPDFFQYVRYSVTQISVSEQINPPSKKKESAAEGEICLHIGPNLAKSLFV